MTVITVSTVGYEEVIDLTGNPAGRIFVIALIFAGMGIILYFVSNVTAFLIDGSLKEIFRRKRMRKMIDEMSGHYIVCGAGTMGSHVAQELVRTGNQAVVIDTEAEHLDRLRQENEDVGLVEGDATENEVLEHAGIARARGLIAATNSDKDNLVITLTARQMRAELRIVSRCSQVAHRDKFLRSGADSVVPMNYIGGMRMASEMIRPDVVSFLDLMLRDKDGKLRIEEVSVPGGSPLEGSPIEAVKARALVLAVLTSGGEYVFNPPETFTLGGGQTIILMGTSEDRKSVEALVAGSG